MVGICSTQVGIESRFLEFSWTTVRRLSLITAVFTNSKPRLRKNHNSSYLIHESVTSTTASKSARRIKKLISSFAVLDDDSAIAYLESFQRQSHILCCRLNNQSVMMIQTNSFKKSETPIQFVFSCSASWAKNTRESTKIQVPPRALDYSII